MEEILIYGSNAGKSGQNATASDQFITAVDLHSGSHVSTFKKSSSPHHGIAVTDKYIIALQYDQAQLFVYTHGRESVSQKIVLPEKLSCLAVSPNSNYLAAGGAQGRLLVWELASGNLVFARDAHYQGVSCLEFTADDAFLISGGKDSRVLVWQTATIVNSLRGGDEIESAAADTLAKPLWSWADHSLPIVDVKAGIGGTAADYRIFSASEDATVKVWDLRSGQLLSTFVLPGKISSIAVDPIERSIYAGLLDGSIHIISLFSTNATTGSVVSLGGAKQVVTVEGQTVLLHHEAAVTSLALSFDSTLLVSGDAAGEVIVWDLVSKLVVRQPKRHRHSIASIQILRRSIPIVPQKTSTTGNSANNSKNGPQIPLLKRIIDPQAVIDHDVYVKIPDSDNQQAATWTLSDIDSQAAQLAVGSDSANGLQLKVVQLQEELDQMKEYYASLKSTHDELWKRHAQAQFK